ncbi:hypothetical protein ACFWA9_04485 [Kitasatospora sp. NPDC059973]|uniref:hypothetical protein n=1 Tax=Kitasatospora sp. NPDC059973 TaxID=3347020 RepID=UPI0036AB2BBC
MVTHPNRDYAITAMYSVSDDAWHLELDLVREHRAVVTAVIPDEDPAREPTVYFDPQGRHLDIPCEVMRSFMDQVADEIRSSRAWMRLRPELVEVILRLRQEYLGAIENADFPDVLAELRAAVPEADLAVGHGRGGDHHGQQQPEGVHDDVPLAAVVLSPFWPVPHV